MRRATILVLALAAGAVGAEEMTPVLATLVAPPVPVLQSDGRWKLAYELELTNVTDAPMTIESVEVRAPGRDAPVVAWSGDAVAGQLSLPGKKPGAVLGPGQAAVLFVDVAADRREDLPQQTTHRLTVTTTDTTRGLPPRLVEEVAPTEVLAVSPIVLGPPLRGERWVAAASCCASYHRRAILPIDGRHWLAQRYAIDWMQLTPDNRMATGDPTRNASFPQYGAEALAVADATVAHVTDGVQEAAPGSFPPGITIATADGNSVVLDLGGGRYALYAHFQPGSIRVQQGDHVTRGQVLGLVGSSGNSDAPHLHFHVMDGSSPLASNGLPYVFETFEVTGRAVSADDLDAHIKTADQPVEVVAVAGEPRRTNELPADLVLVKFPN